MWKCAWWYLWGDDRIRPQHHSAGKRNWILQYETGDLQNIWPQRQIFFWIVSKTTFRTHFQAKTTLSDWDLCCVTVCWDTFWRNAALFRADRTSLRSSYGMLKAKRLPTADKQTCGPSRGAQNSPRRRLFSWHVCELFRRWHLALIRRKDNKPNEHANDHEVRYGLSGAGVWAHSAA